MRDKSRASATPLMIGPGSVDRSIERQATADERRRALFDQFAAATGLQIRSAGDGEFVLSAGDDGPVLLAVPEDAAIEIAENPDQYAERLSFLQDWRQDLLTQGEATEHALDLLRKYEDQGIAFGFRAPTSADEAHEAFLAAAELMERGEDDSAAFEVFQHGLFPELHSWTHNVGWLLDAAPGVGNVRSGEQFLEDVDNAGAAYDRGDYWAAAGHGGLALLDAAGAIPGVGNFFARPAKMAVQELVQHIPVAKRLYAQWRLGRMLRNAHRPAEPELTAGDVIDPRKDLIGANNLLSAGREEVFAEILRDAGVYDFVRQAPARIIDTPRIKRRYDVRVFRDIELGRFGLARPGGAGVKHLEVKGAHATPTPNQNRFSDAAKEGRAVYGEQNIPIRPEDELLFRMLPSDLPLYQLRKIYGAALRNAVAREHMDDVRRRRALSSLINRNTGFLQRTGIGQGIESGYRGSYLNSRSEQSSQ